MAQKCPTLGAYPYSHTREDQAKYEENVIALQQTYIHKEVLFNPLQNSNKSSIVKTRAY